jgi:hypothetical protein
MDLNNSSIYMCVLVCLLYCIGTWTSRISMCNRKNLSCNQVGTYGCHKS